MIAGSIAERVKPHEFRIAGALVILESAFLLWSSLQPGAALESVSFLYLNSDIFGHLLAYLVYGALLGRMFQMNGNSDRKSVILAIVVGGSFGLINELIQLGVPGRGLSLMDIRVNIVASAIGAIISTRMLFRNQKAA